MPELPLMHNDHSRIQFIDFLRGFAVIVMVIGHSLDSVLSQELRTSELFGYYNVMRGFTAPLFLFVAGFAFLVATRKRWEEYRVLSRPLKKRVVKMSGLILIGYAMHFPFFSFTKIVQASGPQELSQLLQVDILQCLAVSILLLHALIWFSPTEGSFVRILSVVTAAIVLLAPWIWSFDFAPFLSPVIAPYLNQQQVSLFPMVPYTAFLYAGVVAGHYYSRARLRQEEQKFFRLLLALAVGMIATGLLWDRLPFSVYPPHDFWKTSPNFFLIRLGVVSTITTVFFMVRGLKGIPARQLVVLGQASLLVYVVHLVLVYGSAANAGLAQVIGKTLQVSDALAIAVGVLLLMLFLVHAWNYARTHHKLPLRLVQYGIFSSLVYLFFTQPY
jgi:uncharacterized membrane protein